MKRTVLLCLLTLTLLAAVPARADFNDGVVAYLMGDYERAYNTMRSLAETTEHAYAQYYVGMMYLNGQGVDQSYEEAGAWFRKAAEQRIPQAQYKLGVLYAGGQGVPRDFERAYAWYRVGAEHQHQKSIEALDDARGMLSELEMREAEKYAQELIRDYGPTEESGGVREIEAE